MGIDPALLTSNFRSFQPFGATSPKISDQPCRMTSDLNCGRGSGLAGVLMWTHIMDIQPGQDILDGVTRSPGSDTLLYADGDGVESPYPNGSMYVVVWVAEINPGTGDNFTRVWLLRDTY